MAIRKAAASLALAAILLSSIGALGTGIFSPRPAFAVEFDPGEAGIFPTSTVVGDDSTYIISFEVQTRAVVRNIVVDFPVGYDVSGASFGGASNVKEDGQLDVAGNTVTYELRKAQRLAIGTDVALIIAGVVNPADEDDYDIDVATTTSSDVDVDFGTVTVTIDPLVADADALGTGVVGSDEIADGAIVDADVSAAAAVSSDKIDFTDGIDSATSIFLTANGAGGEVGITQSTAGGTINFNVAGDVADEISITDDLVTITGDAALPAGSIETGEIEDSTIVSADIAADTLLAEDIATNAIGALELADDSVASANIIADTIDDTDVVDDGLDATSLAANSVGASELADDSVATDNIISNTITDADISDDSLTALSLAADSVAASEIAAGAVGTSELADGTVASADIADGTIVNADVSAAAAIESDKLDYTDGIAMDGGTISDATDEVDVADDLATTGDITVGGGDIALSAITATITTPGGSALTIGDGSDTTTVPGSLTVQGTLNLPGTVSAANLAISEDSILGNAEGDITTIKGSHLIFEDPDSIPDEEDEADIILDLDTFQIRADTDPLAATSFEQKIEFAGLGAAAQTIQLGADDGDDAINIIGTPIVLDGDAGTDEFTLTDTALTITDITTMDVDTAGDITVEATAAGASIQIDTSADGVAIGAGTAAVEPADGEFGVDTAGTVDINAATTVTVDTTAGSITLTAGGAGSDITLAATGTGDADIVIGNAGGDDVLITAADDIELNAAASTVFIDPGNDDSNEVTVSDTAITMANIDTITGTAATDITLTSAATSDSDVAIAALTGGVAIGAGNAAANPADGEVDITNTGTVDINAGTSATLDAATDISVTAAATADSDVLAAALTGGVAIGAGNAAANPADGEFDVTTAGTVDINAGSTVTIDSLAGSTTITATGAGNDINLAPADELDITSGGTVDINAGTSATLDAATDISVTAAATADSDVLAAALTGGVAIGAGNAAANPADGEADITTTGLVDVNAGTDVTIDTAGAGDEVLVTTDTGGISLRVGGATVDPADGELDVTTSGTVDINAGTTATIDAATDISVTAAATADSDVLTAALTGGVAIGAGNAAANPDDGEVDITNTGLVDVNAGTDVTIDTAGTDDEILLTTDTGGISVRAGGATVNPADGELDVTTSGIIDVNGGSSITIDSTTTADVLATTTGSFTGTTGLTLQTTAAGADVTVETDGGANSEVFIHTATGGISLTAGAAAVDPADGAVVISAVASSSFTTTTGTLTIQNSDADTGDNLIVRATGASNDLELHATGGTDSDIDINANNAGDGDVTVTANDDITVTADGLLTLIGTADGVVIGSGSTALTLIKFGTFTLDADADTTVADTAVTVDSVIIITFDTAAGTADACIADTLSAGASFNIHCENNADAETGQYILINRDT